MDLHCYMTRSIYLGCVLFWLPRWCAGCMFYDIYGYKMAWHYITRNETVSKFHDDCEFLCYKDSDSCTAANVVTETDGSFVCQFVSVSVQTGYLDLMSDNPKGRYFSRAAVQVLPPDVSMTTSNGCSASSTASNSNCDEALDGVPGTDWVSQGQGVNAWFQVQIQRTDYLMTKVQLKGRCTNVQADSFNEVSLNFADGTSQVDDGFNCYNTNDDCYGDPIGTIKLVPRRTANTFTITILQLCSTAGASNVGIKTIAVYAWKL